MSISVTGYTEAKIEGKWYCIDFWFFTESCGIDRNAIDKRSMKDF